MKKVLIKLLCDANSHLIHKYSARILRLSNFSVTINLLQTFTKPNVWKLIWYLFQCVCFFCINNHWERFKYQKYFLIKGICFTIRIPPFCLFLSSFYFFNFSFNCDPFTISRTIEYRKNNRLILFRLRKNK